MAKIVLAGGTSHTPLLTFGSSLWREYSARDTKNSNLNLSDGQYITYAELLSRTNGKFSSQATEDVFVSKERHCQESLNRLSADIRASSPDVVLVITDDESELFSRANTPALSIYYGDSIITRPFSSKMLDLDDPPPYFARMATSYAMDKPRTFPAMADLGRELIERMIAKHFDVGAAAQVEDPTRSGFGHGVGFVIQRLFDGQTIPVVPILLNTYYPPNAPLPARCFDIGRALREAIEASSRELRVAILASGGLSHFIVDEELDRNVMRSIMESPEELRDIPVGALNSGSSEIRNWIVLGGAVHNMRNQWLEYEPLYRTPAGTGIGAAFGVWKS